MTIHAINTQTLGISEYTGLDFIALVEHEGRTYGLTATGLYELVGADDDGTDIDASIDGQDILIGSFVHAQKNLIVVMLEGKPAADAKVRLTLDHLNKKCL